MRGEGTFETVTRVLALQREGRDIVSMEVGDPGFDTPTHITDAAVEVR
jgi:aspartate/methionine/tyrosine aminotransferase